MRIIVLLTSAVKSFGKVFFTILLVCLFLLTSVNAKDLEITNEIGMTFIRVNPVTFNMGSPKSEQGRQADEALHAVTLSSPFYLQETEVTLKQWRSIMGRKWLNPRKGQPDSPVTRVSFYDCQKFIEKLNAKGEKKYRLPTEAEWEFACRAGTDTAFSFGDTIDCSQALYANNTKKISDCVSFLKKRGIKPNKPAPVKTFAPNPWGFYDMHGNVWEWCQDTYGPYKLDGGASDYSLTSSNSRVRRGGSWFGQGRSLRSANRTYAHPGSKFPTTGFRLVLEAGE